MSVSSALAPATVMTTTDALRIGVSMVIATSVRVPVVALPPTVAVALAVSV